MKRIYKSNVEPLRWENGKGTFGPPNWYVQEQHREMARVFELDLIESIGRLGLKKVDDKPTEIGLF